MSDERPPCPPPVQRVPEPLPLVPLPNPLYGNLESVDVTKRDEHIQAFRAAAAKRRADPNDPWHRKARK